MKIICKHCQLNNKCGVGIKDKCDRYQPIANRPDQLKSEIKQAYVNQDHTKAEQLRKELDYFWYGDINKK